MGHKLELMMEAGFEREFTVTTYGYGELFIAVKDTVDKKTIHSCLTLRKANELIDLLTRAVIASSCHTPD